MFGSFAKKLPWGNCGNLNFFFHRLLINKNTFHQFEIKENSWNTENCYEISSLLYSKNLKQLNNSNSSLFNNFNNYSISFNENIINNSNQTSDSFKPTNISISSSEEYFL